MGEKYFFLLSGFDKELPYGELKALIAILHPEHEIIKRDGRIVIVKTLKDVAEEIVERSAYTKLSAQLLFETHTNQADILSSIDISILKEFIPPNSTILVRGLTINGASVNKSELERQIGALIIDGIPSLKVDLRNPEFTVVFISSPEKTYIGILRKIKPKRIFYYRVAGRRPFTLPSAMQPDLSRCLVNLSRTMIGGRILDPFTGTGGILIEAILLGYEAYGVELKKWIAQGALRNLKYYTPSLENIIIGDARKLMFRKCFDSIVTDPPYGRSTTVPDHSLTNLLEKFLYESRNCLRDGGTVTLVTPENIWIEDTASEAGYTLRESYTIKIHRSLIRKIMVFK